MKNAFLLTALIAMPLMAAPALANTRAVLVAPVTDSRAKVINETPWTCDGVLCRAPSTGSSRLEIQCIRVAKALGKIAEFSVDGIAFAADQLEACNAKAKRV
jgi:hypothetical protein